MSMTSASNDDGFKGTADQGDGGGDIATAWERISLFRVTVQQRDKVTAPVYANGRQQIPFQIEIVAQNKNGEEVTLNAAQLSSISLIVYQTGASLPSDVNVSSSQDSKYAYNWNVGNSPGSAFESDEVETDHRDPSTLGQLQSFWLRKTGVGTIKVAAKITSSTGVVYTTNTPNPTPGKFDSWVIIDGREPVVHPWDALTIGDRKDLITGNGWDVDMYYIRFHNSNGANLRIVDSVHHNHSADHHFYSWPKGGWARKSSAAFRAGDRRSVVFPPGVWSGCYFDVNTKAGQANAARLSHSVSHNLHETYSFGRVTYFDQHGNAAPAVIGVSSDGNLLNLQSTGPHAFVDYAAEVEQVGED